MLWALKQLTPMPAWRGLIRFCILPAILTMAPLSALAVEKSVEVERQHRDEPVIITSVTLGNMELQCGLVADTTGFQSVTPFAAGDDWLQNTTIYILNRTNKDIAFGQIALAFPETGDGSSQKPIATYNITLGRIPQSAAFSGRTGQPLVQSPTRQPLSFAPGQTLAIHVADYIDQIKGNINTVPFSALTRVVIRRTVFFFDDGMKWDGAFSIPDPKNPGKWNPVEGRYFPGVPGWPPK